MLDGSKKSNIMIEILILIPFSSCTHLFTLKIFKKSAQWNSFCSVLTSFFFRRNRFIQTCFFAFSLLGQLTAVVIELIGVINFGSISCSRLKKNWPRTFNVSAFEVNYKHMKRSDRGKKMFKIWIFVSHSWWNVRAKKVIQEGHFFSFFPFFFWKKSLKNAPESEFLILFSLSLFT